MFYINTYSKWSDEDQHKYHYVETSDTWKKACSTLPSNGFLAWPGYRTTVYFDVWIDGHGPLIIQPWKGWCQRLNGNKGNFPGGVGAEVGIYQKIPALGPVEINPQPQWFPYIIKFFQLDFKLINPNTGDVFFRAQPETTYWLNRWMQHDDYEVYKKKHPRAKLPANPAAYILEFTVAGHKYTWN